MTQIILFQWKPLEYPICLYKLALYRQKKIASSLYVKYLIHSDYLLFFSAEEKKKKCQVLSVAQTLQPWIQAVELAMSRPLVAFPPMSSAPLTLSLPLFSSLMFMVRFYWFIWNFFILKFSFCLMGFDF